MGVVIRKTDTGYTWQPDNAKTYNIQLEQILPDRAKQLILQSFRDDATTKVYFPFYLYLKGSRVLFLSHSKF